MKETAAATEMVRGSNLLVINGYSAAKGIGVGKYVASDELAVGGYKWAIYFYPYGKTPEEHNFDYVSIYVALLSQVADDDYVKAQFEITLIDQTGKGNHKVHTCFDKPPTQIQRMWGYNKFLRRATLEKSNYLRDDCLKIYCSVGVVVDSAAIDREMVERPMPSCCSVIETTSGSNLFVIQGYSMAKGIGDRKWVSSNEFWAGGYKWAICFNPRAKKPQSNSSSVSVLLKLASEGTDVQAMIGLTLMDQTGKGKHKKVSCFNKQLTFKYGAGRWGFKLFSSSARLEKSDYLRDDCLKIYCSVGVVVSAIDCSRFCSIRVPESDIALHIGMLLRNMEGFDITFMLSGEKIYAHKLILAARCPKILQGVITEEVMVPDIEPKVFKALLHFIYTDTLAENEPIASAPSVSETLAAKLLAAANRYDLERLKRLCEYHLCKFITVNSVVELLALADRYHAAELKDVCLKFAADQNVTGVRRWDVSDEENWTSLNCEVLDSDEDIINISNGDNSSNRRVRKRTAAEMVLDDFKSLQILP